MAEIFGIVSFQNLTPQDYEGINRIKADLQKFESGQLILDTQPGVVVGVLACQADNHVVLSHSDDKEYTLAWLGKSPFNLNSEPEASLLISLLEQTRKTNFQTTVPPFAGCVIDHISEQCWLISDSYRLQPIYYANQSGKLMFCSKLTPLLCSGLINWELDKSALLDFFTYEHVTGVKTFANSVSMMPAASILKFGKGHVGLSSYFEDDHEGPDKTLSVSDVTDRLYDELSHSVNYSLENVSNAAITLSGGLDSRAILGCAIKTTVKLKAFTFGRSGCADINIAQELAKCCGIPHVVIPVDGSFLPEKLDFAVNVTDGMVGAIHFHILALADYLSAGTSCVLDGFGGDALTGAHLSLPMLAACSVARAADLVYRSRATVFADTLTRNNFLDPDFMGGVNYKPRQAVEKHFEGLGKLPYWWGCHRFDLLDRQQRFIQFGTHLLRSKINVATPFYSPALVNFLKRAPAKALIEQRAYLKVHTKYLRELAKVKDDKRGVPLCLPQSLRFLKRVYDFTGRKIPQTQLRKLFAKPLPQPTDYSCWFRSNLRSFVEERLLDDRSIFQGIIRRDSLITIVQDHISGKSDNKNQIGCLLSLSSWLNSIKNNPNKKL